MTFPIAFLRAVIAMFASIAAASFVCAADVYPTRPIRMIVGFAPGTPEQFGAYIRSERIKWAKVIKASGAKAE